MDARTVYTVMQQQAPTATMDDAEAFLAICQDRGLSPFVEASPLITDYTRQRDGKHVHSLAVKEHYSVQERWSQQSGGYIVNSREVFTNETGDIVARIGVISNRDYAGVGKLAAMVPGFSFKEELARFEVIGEAVVTKDERGKRQPPASKTWEWVAEKRAREAALRQKFGKEPSQARQLYTNALALGLDRSERSDVIEALYPPARREALPAPTPAPVIDGQFADSDEGPDWDAVEVVKASPTPQPEKPGDAEEARTVALAKAAEIKTAKGTRLGDLSPDQLQTLIDLFEGKALTGEQAGMVAAAKLLRDYLTQGAAA